MDQVNCISCDSLISLESIFCYKCGVRIKCYDCNNPLLKDANFCAKCGVKVGSSSSNHSSEKNTVKYRRTKDEVFCEVSLSDTVGKEGINGLIQNLTNNNNRQKMLNDRNGSHGLEGKDDEFVDTEIIGQSNQGIQELEHIPEGIDKSSNETQELPHIDDVEKNLTCTESGWILIYAYYISSFGKKTFSKEEVYEKYMSKRRTDTRGKNFATNWKSLFKQYLETVKENEIKFKKDKLVEIKELVLGHKRKSVNLNKGRTNSIVSTKNVVDENAEKGAITNKSSKKRSASSVTYSFITSLNLIPKNKQSLKEFFSQFKDGNMAESTLKIVYYLEKVLGEKGINENTIYTCYKFLSIPVPNIRQTLNNIHTRKGWIRTSDFSDLKVNVAGENYIEHNMEKV